MCLRLAVHAPNYNCDEFVIRWINNVGLHVEKIYLAYPERPWGYNPDARARLSNQADVSLIHQSRYADKVEIVTGDWETEEETRNECLLRARNDGFDFLIVQDLDEFYNATEFAKNIHGLREHPDYCSYRAPWHIFWKDTRHVICFRNVVVRPAGKILFSKKNSTIAYMAAFALNCKTDVRFREKRMPTHLESVFLLDGLCCHLSMVLSDEAMKEKLGTWGHANQVKKKWYRYKWEAWQLDSRNICHIDPPLYAKAELFSGDLPEEIKDFKAGLQSYRALTLFERIGEVVFDYKYLFVYYLKVCKRVINRKKTTK